MYAISRRSRLHGKKVVSFTSQTLIDVAHLSPKVALGQWPGAALPPLPGMRLATGLPAILPPDGLPLVALRDAWERSMIEQALERHGGNIAAVARCLQVTRDRVTHRCAKFDIDPRAYDGA